MIGGMDAINTPCRAALVALLAIVLVTASNPASVAAQTVGEQGPWLDLTGEPLPFQSDDEILDALRTATVVSRTQVDRPGLEGVDMLLLEAEDAQFYALFRAEGEASRFELAAYEIDRMLELGHVPPVIVRRIEGEEGIVQIWRQRAGTEVEVAEAGQLIPPDPRDFDLQHQEMYLFDNLIANPRRSEANILIDPSWRLWLIDHSAAFDPTSDLLYELELTKCERGLWQRLQDLDRDELEERVAPYLDSKQQSKLAKRHRVLVKHVYRMIKTFGEDVVLY